MNKVFMVGRLVADPQPYTTANGNEQARITIATQDNRVKTESYFFPCIAWNNQAKFINTYLKKGDLVAIDGKLTRRSFTSKEGKTIYTTEVVIESINSLGSKRSDTKSQEFKSIDKAFEENVTTQIAKPEVHKSSPVHFDSNLETEWYDETTNKENK